MKKTVLVKSLLVMCLVSGFMDYAFSENTGIKLNSNDGTTKFIVQNKDAVTVFSADSDGNTVINGTATVAGSGFSVGGSTLVVKDGNVGIGTTSPGSTLDVQGGNINTSGKLQESGNSLLPAGAVMFFNLASCPTGWSALAAAQGRYLVGEPSGGTLAGTDGTALGDLEDRPVGQHSHSITDKSHYHGAGNGMEFSTQNSSPNSNCSNGNTSGQNYVLDTAPSFTGITGTNPYGSVAGTNAPYIQLLVCQKN